MIAAPMARAAKGSTPRRPIIAVSPILSSGWLAKASMAGTAKRRMSLRCEVLAASLVVVTMKEVRRFFGKHQAISASERFRDEGCWRESRDRQPNAARD